MAATGPVKLQRWNWQTSVPVDFGTMLYTGDFLEPEGEATILCADLSVDSVVGSGRPCARAQSAVMYFRGAPVVVSLRGASAVSAIPYVLYPRNTLTLHSRPTIRWHDTGAASYRVTIMQGTQAIWTQDATTAEIRYSDDAPELAPGIDYHIVVVDNDSGKSSELDRTRGTGFQVIDLDAQRIVEQTQERIESIAELDITEQQFALALYYASADVSSSGFRPIGDAWLLLEQLAALKKTPAIYLRMGDVLTAMKLSDEPIAAYRAALAAAESLGDKESQADAHTALWRILDEQEHLDQAIALYTQLGDTTQVDALRKESNGN